jgi:hypothetical protein
MNVDDTPEEYYTLEKFKDMIKIDLSNYLTPKYYKLEYTNDKLKIILNA